MLSLSNDSKQTLWGSLMHVMTGQSAVPTHPNLWHTLQPGHVRSWVLFRVCGFPGCDPHPSPGLPCRSGFTWPPLTVLAQQPAQSLTYRWLELSEAHGVRSCCCERLSQGLPSAGHQTAHMTLIRFEQTVPRATHYAASSSWKNALQVTAQQTEVH